MKDTPSEFIEARFREEAEKFSARIIHPELEQYEDPLIAAYSHLVVSGIGGAGKTTVVRHLEDLGATVLPTVTTRERRESDGEDRVNVSENEFLRMLASGELLFWHENNRHLQGFPRSNLDLLKNNEVCVTDKSMFSVKKLHAELEKDLLSKVAFVYLVRPSVLDSISDLMERSEYTLSRNQAHTLEEIDGMSEVLSYPNFLVVKNEELDATLKWFEALGELPINK